MVGRDTNTEYVRLQVGDYRLALPAHLVLSVYENINLRQLAKESSLIAMDLASLFTKQRRARAPAAAVLDLGEDKSYAVGVTSIDFLRWPPNLEVFKIPRAGIERPDLYEGAAYSHDELILIISPSALAKVIREDLGI